MTCCSTVTSSEETAACPSCGARGLRVQPITVKALLNPSGLQRGPVEDPRFCATATCPVVYFETSQDRMFTEHDLLVRVHAKHPEDDEVPVCYCFDVTPRAIQREVALSGRTTASERIGRDVKAGRCACEVKNPRGVCCLGDVIRVEKAAMNTDRASTRGN